MTRNSCTISVGSSAAGVPSTVAAQPLIEVSGARNSWLTMPRNWARSRSTSSTGVMSCSVTISDSTSPVSERMGVALTSVVTRRWSGNSRTISSARTGTASRSMSPRADSSRKSSRPSPRRTRNPSSSSAAERPGLPRSPTIRRDSRFSDTTRPLLASNTTTPTGEVSINASRSARARCSSRYSRALAIAAPACEANGASTSSSSRVNSCPPTLSAR